ncbi:putative peptidoglycan glycosyltransferase FtsW [Devosia sp. MC521]|uniref:FtsW/RodA/SpoVE family cell cycle protein n=1 Tax=Devosia sp. MC521 TaxID=2759954 RepID=UPI0015F7AE36|nr:putative peptidoglycan glycosyltransferase FtsW [Devosia sp. MC521]MBJ6986618.1 cell division protein FtsW [Devosia sp. MC521]QMW64562.1 cell division protein FtsW [Devosia sp. MC521]
MFSRAEKTWLAEWWWSIDRELLGALIMLLACGMVLSFGASPAVAERIGLDEWHFVIRHAMFCVLAVPVMLATSLLSHRQARLSALFVLVVMTVLLWATLYFGTEVKGARRWVSLAGQSIQPSEFVKPAFAVISAWLFSESLIHRNVPGRWMAAGLMVLIVAALLLQPDVGQTALVVATWAVLLFFSGISWWVIIGLGLLAVSALAGAYMFFPHVSRRIDTFINPDAGGNTYQIDRAIHSLLEGGWFGRGPGESLAKKLIPDAHADYVFSAAAGEFGILFCMGLVGLIAFIVIRAMISAQRQTSLFARLAASTIAVQFAMQSGINLAVNLNLIPPKGMTLPFVSYGGTSMFAVAFGMGLMLALTRTKPEERMATGIPSYRSAVVAPAE